ncbi:MAG: type II toxin-antitoxin system RelE/ParE family toxin [Acidobacteria bacterium]|nr:type II toxin-antitoxin system RelE/ParE family toxin [Acidobacteriota bacterium]
MTYRLEFTSAAARQFRKLPASVQARLAPHIAALSENANPPGSKKLKGTDGSRLRVGNYRILYEIEHAASLVRIMKVGHRREVYR